MDSKTTWGLVLALLLSLIANIILILHREEGGESHGVTPPPTVADDKEMVKIRPCVYYEEAGKMNVDSCWGDTMQGGTFTMTTLMSIYAQNPDSINCISYSFARNTSTDDPRYRDKLYLIMRGCYYEMHADGSCKIYNVSGRPFSSDWVCPENCPM